MNKTDKSILIALALGDGYINPQGGMTIEHSLAQEEYVKWKQAHLLRICGGKYNKLYYRNRVDKRTNKEYRQVSCHKQHKYLRIIRNWLYRPNKTYSLFILNKLTPEGLAIWYMDDGNLSSYTSKKTGKISSIQVCLYTMGPLDETELVRDWFISKYGIEFKIYKLKHKEMYYLCAGTKDGNKFLDLVRPHMIHSLLYKVNVNSKSAEQSLKKD